MKRKILESLVWGSLVAIAFSFTPESGLFLTIIVAIIAMGVALWRYLDFVKEIWNKAALSGSIALLSIGFAWLVTKVKLIESSAVFNVDLGLSVGVLNSGVFMISFLLTLLTLKFMKKIQLDVIGKVFVLSAVIITISLFWFEAGRDIEYDLSELGMMGAKKWKFKYFMKIKVFHFLKDIICWSALFFVTRPTQIES